ncbi:MAG: hypothetical protein JSC161_000925 [Candidatus Tokpelaia sp. JSC161]|jgi:hypothetical protein|nr:MAG: hypothetical protein JSC161_000925 [Candidatus Tokpelaia sp. JSC161]
MKRIGYFFIIAFTTITFLASGMSLLAADNIKKSHFQAAHKVLSIIHATDQFDYFLPHTMIALKNELMRNDPHLEKMISQTVDEQAMILIERRADLEREVVGIYAKHFTEDELKNIAIFYSSPVGKKLLMGGPEAMADSVKAYDMWRQAFGHDLAVNVEKALNEKLGRK